MAIARMLKTEIVCATRDDARLLAALEKERIIQIDDIHENLAEEFVDMETAPRIETGGEENALQSAKTVLDAFSRYSPIKKSLLENFFGSPPYVDEDSFRDIASSVDMGEYESNVGKITSEMDAVARSLEKNSELKSVLEPWVGLDQNLSGLTGLKHVLPIALVASPARIAEILDSLQESVSAGDVEWAPVQTEEKRASGILFAVPSAAAETTKSIKSLGAEPVRLPELDETPREALARIDSETEQLLLKKEGLEDSILKSAEEGRRRVQAVADEHTGTRDRHLARRKLFYTKNAVAVRGWTPERDRGRLESMLGQKFPDSEVRFTTPSLSDNPPVKLENPRLLRPFQSILEMFGLPPYFGVDSTWFVAVAMALFYAICLGDAGYGACQILLTWWLLRKFKPAEGTRLFLLLFMEMGVCTVVFGILTWSFFGFSPGYAVGGPKILGFLPIFMPSQDVLLIMGIAAVIGALFQLGSILIGFYASLKSGDKAGAYFDRLAWLVFLIGGLVFLATLFFPGLPAAVRIAGLVLCGAGFLTILLFAGRDSKSIVGRIAVGVISFYGIVGYYGVVSFFGDVLSYLRLAILNLTGGYIAFVANTIGQLLRGGGGIVAAVLMTVISLVPILFFHVLNFVLSMQGSFVHSLRLNYLESFSRYYGTGGKAFSPLKKEGRYYRFEE